MERKKGCFVMCKAVSKKSPQVFIKVHKIHKILTASNRGGTGGDREGSELLT